MSKKRNLIRERSITSSHIWHVDIPKCIYVEIEQFRYEWLSIMYEKIQKNAIIKSKVAP